MQIQPQVQGMFNIFIYRAVINITVSVNRAVARLLEIPSPSPPSPRKPLIKTLINPAFVYLLG